MRPVNTHGRSWSVRGRSVGRGHQKTDSPQIIKSSVAHLGDNSPGPVEWVLHETLFLCRAASFDADSLSDSLKSYHSVFSTHTCLFIAFTRNSSTDLDRNYCCPLGSWELWINHFFSRCPASDICYSIRQWPKTVGSEGKKFHQEIDCR